MPIRDEHQHTAEQRSDSDPSISLARAANFSGVSLSVIAEHFSVREADEAAYKMIRLVARYINPILRNTFQRRIGRRCEVPIELHLHPTWPLDHRVHSDRILKRLHDDFGTRSPCSLDCRVHIVDQISGTLLTIRKGHCSLICKDRQRADGTQYVLHLGAASHWRDIPHDPLRRLSAESSDKAADERIQIGGDNVDVRGVVLRTHSNVAVCREPVFFTALRSRERRSQGCGQGHHKDQGADHRPNQDSPASSQSDPDGQSYPDDPSASAFLTANNFHRNFTSASVVSFGCSSMSQCPGSFSTTTVTSIATSFACSPITTPFPLSPPMVNTGIVNLVCASCAKSLAACWKETK